MCRKLLSHCRQQLWVIFVNQFHGGLTERASLVAWEGWVPDRVIKRFAVAHIWITKSCVWNSDFKVLAGSTFFLEHTGISLQHAVKSKKFFLSFLYKQVHSSLLPSSQPCFRQSQILFLYPAANHWPLAVWRIKYIKNLIVPLISKSAYLAPVK